MAASSKPTGVHVALIVFIMSTIIFGVMWYLEMGERKSARDAAAQAKSEKDISDRLKDDRVDELREIVRLYGNDVPTESIGLGAPDEQTNLFIPGMKADLKKYSKDAAQQSVRAAYAELALRINTLEKEKAGVQAQFETAQAKIMSLQKEMQGRVDTFSKSATDEAARAQKAVADLDEAVKSKNSTIDGLTKQLADERVQSEATQDRLQKEIDKLKKDYDALIAANNKLQDDLQAAKQYSFEQPDGEVRWVDHAQNLVWINLGEADQLPPRTSFSVYTKAHSGVARGSQDVKGAIEVVRNLGPHLAEARILRTDDKRPIAVGDPIYTPLWSAGKVEYFALLGKIDFDGDGRDDRGRLHDLIAAANGRIESEVDDKGILNGPGITVRTRFLVIGEIPSPLTSQLLPDEIEAANKMNELDAQLRTQARQQGVRVVSLNDFLNYVGYTATRRIWAPGENRPYALQSQAPKVGIDEVVPYRQHESNRKRPTTGSGARIIESQEQEAQPKKSNAYDDEK